MKRLMYLLAIVGCLFCFTAADCNGPTQKPTDADAIQKEQTKRSMAEAQRQVGMPAIKNFQERKLAKMIFELRDREDFVCHAYLYNYMTGSVGQYLGKCLGYGLPYSVQFTNPLKMETVDGGEYGARNPYLLPQADPNNLFMPSGLSATWIMLYDPTKEDFRPVYVEPLIIVSPFPLEQGSAMNPVPTE